jgi:SecD/SecF fusion protein
MYILGSDQVKGFAVTLWLGVAISMFTSVFVARVLFDIAEKRQWITQAKMMRIIGHTHIDFMGLFKYTIWGTAIVTVLAVVVAFYRGQGLFDIDFTGGVSVQALFDQRQDTSEIRKDLSDKLPDLAISDVKLQNEAEGLRFVINTSEPSMGVVRKVLTETFGEKLKHNSFNFTEPKLIPSETAAPAEKSVEPKNKQSRNDLPSDRLLAFAGDPATALALADAPAKPAETKKEEPKKDEKPADAAAKDKPAETSATKAAPRKPTPEEVKAVTPAKPAADPYAGGTLSQLKFAEAVNHQAVTEMIVAAIEEAKLDPKTDYQLSTEGYTEGQSTAYKEWDLRIRLAPEKTQALLKAMAKQVEVNPIFPASSTIGAAVAGNTQKQAIYALVVSWICMIVYLWIRFQGVAFGLAAVIALIHDVFVMLGAVAVSIYIAPYTGFLLIEPFKINLPIVAAFLTIIGFSVNDTIVVFDRIREIRGKNPYLTREMVNAATNQTLSRTILTSFTVLLVTVVLYIAGGEAVHGFAFALLVGVATGTYSSIYIAAPILLWLVGKHEEKISG